MTIPIINMTETGRNIIRLRENADMSVRDLQDIFGFTTPQAIYKWQNGMSLPTLDNLVLLSAVFHVAIEDIIAVDERDNE